MNQYITQNEAAFLQAVDHFKQELNTLRAGSVTPNLLDAVMVEAYGSYVPMKQVASVKVMDAQTLVIEPWDKTLLKSLESVLSQTDLGAMPIIDGSIIRINVPAPSEERRKELVKKLHGKIEETKITIRNIREKIRESIIKDEKDKLLSEDEKFQFLEELDTLVKQYNEDLQKLGKEKEEKIMTI